MSFEINSFFSFVLYFVVFTCRSLDCLTSLSLLQKEMDRKYCSKENVTFFWKTFCCAMYLSYLIVV